MTCSCSCACCRSPSTSTSSRRSRTCSSPSCRRRTPTAARASTSAARAGRGAQEAAGRTAGVASLADLNWKQVLDAFSCTECGRCTAVCPATAAGTPLAPRQLILDLRDGLYHGHGDGPLIPDEVLWSCTTCMACVEACPVGIEHVPTIVDMRRSLVDQGEMDPLLQQTLQNFAARATRYGKSARMRARWTQGAGLQDPRRPQGAGRVRVVRRRLRVLRRARAAHLAGRRADPARRGRLVRAALRGRAQLRQRRAPGR